MALQLGHEGLAEAHDLVVALALGIEVRAALAAAHGQAGQGVLEDLLEAQELDDGQVDGGVEPQAALGGADGGGELHPVAAVDLHLAVVVHPGDAEQQAALRLHNPVDDAGFGQPLVLLHHGLEGFQHLADGLEKLRLVGILPADIFIDALEIRIGKGKCHIAKPFLLAPARQAAEFER